MLSDEEVLTLTRHCGFIENHWNENKGHSSMAGSVYVGECHLDRTCALPQYG